MQFRRILVTTIFTVFLLLLTINQVWAQASFTTNFEEYPDGTPASALDIEGVEFVGRGFAVIPLFDGPGGNLLNKTLESILHGCDSISELALQFSTPVHRVTFQYFMSAPSLEDLQNSSLFITKFEDETIEELVSQTGGLDTVELTGNITALNLRSSDNSCGFGLNTLTVEFASEDDGTDTSTQSQQEVEIDTSRGFIENTVPLPGTSNCAIFPKGTFLDIVEIVGGTGVAGFKVTPAMVDSGGSGELLASTPSGNVRAYKNAAGEVQVHCAGADKTQVRIIRDFSDLSGITGNYFELPPGF